MITHHRFGDTLWIDVADPDEDELLQLAAEQGLDQRVFDEAHRRAARPMLRRVDGHAYLVAFTGTMAEIDMWLGDGWFVTVRRHDDEGREWDPSATIDRVRRQWPGADAGLLAAAVLDDLVDGYFDASDLLEDRLEQIEDGIFGETLVDEQSVQEQLFGVRRELLELRRAVVPLRDVLQAVLRREVQWIDGEALTTCRDTFDKLLRAVDIVDELRELVGNAVEAHLAVVSNQMNLVMKQLTAWGSIVFGATLIAGIYGMNFANMPELDWRLGYPFALGLMLALSLLLYRAFRRRKWL